MRRRRGATLLEVVLAMAVMAICVLGQLATQISLSRQAQAASARERAAFAADAIAEASLAPSPGAADQWKARVPAIVPQGAIALSGAGGDATVVTVATITWAATQSAASPDSAQSDVGDDSSCEAVSGARGRACFSMAFSK
ncbi:type IV pilus modification PilV family protein [Paraburkholderia ferrariae]|uniref:type IV pilus modification PilV family protein n=1 Tax=Paraburkholderia ferrariae TaxID=386056 RepID=UPI000ADCBC54|nr:prepilin-type N-terminal cleavage/methylation domain-containing protein [Paraburkholderia ferrariae]